MDRGQRISAILPRCAIALLALVEANAGGALAKSPAAAPQESLTLANAAAACAGLFSRTVPAAAFALPTRGATIAKSVLMPADPGSGMPEYCRLRGTIAAADPADPPINFQVNLPTRWNLKTVQFGGGGTNQKLIEATGWPSRGGPPVPRPLAQGYVTYGSDSGNAIPTWTKNAQAFANYAHEHVKRAKDLATAVVKLYYGRDARRNYHMGGSKGGHEGLQAVQRYVGDFDGAVAFYPASQILSMQIGYNRMWYYAFGIPGAALNPMKQAFVTQSLMNACDVLDGAKDGLISAVKSCEKAFHIDSLRCPGGADGGDDCLSDVQIASFKAVSAAYRTPYPMLNGIDAIGPFPVLAGAPLSDWFGTGVDNTQLPLYRGSTAVLPGATETVGISKADWDKQVAMSQVFDATRADLDALRDKGGKLLIVQGTADMLVPASTTDRYVDQLKLRYGAGLRKFVRYYVQPGYGHGGGAFIPRWDALAALDSWVEAGKPPVDPVAIDAAEATRGRTRPLCEYPLYPRYKGSGSLDEAVSYRCVRE